MSLLFFLLLLSCSGLAETGQPAILSPTPGSTLAFGPVTFTWNAVAGADKYKLEIGNVAGAADWLSQETTATSLTVAAQNLPSDGRMLFVRIGASIGGSYGSPSSVTYRAFGVQFATWFVPATPCRLMETRAAYNFEGRSGAFGPPSMGAGETRTLSLLLSNNCFVPANAKSVVLNVTVIPKGTLGSATLWAAGEPKPNVWSIRSLDGQTVANTVIVASGTQSGFHVSVSDASDVVIDVSGYFLRTTSGPGYTYYPTAPCRAIETRSAYRAPGPFGAPSMAARETRKFRLPASPNCVVPAAAAYSVTLTAVPPGPLAYLTAWPDGANQPNVSSINSFAGRTLANSLILPASADGTIDVFAYDATDFIVDITGYFARDDGATGLFYYTVPQCRAYDTTAGPGPFADDSTRTIGIPTLPGCANIPSQAKAYTINVTALPNGSPMPFLTAYPTGQARPNASMLNAFEGQVVTNSAIVPAGANGAIDIYAYRRTDLVVEVSGFFGR